MKVDTEVSKLADKYNAAYNSELPVFVVFNHGKKIDRKSGTASLAGISRMLDKALTAKQ